MFGFLEEIQHGIESIPVWILNGVIEVVNLLIAAVALLIEGILAILPSMPTRPTLPEDGVVGFINWLIPGEAFIANAVIGMGLVVFFMLARIALNWAKAS